MRICEYKSSRSFFDPGLSKYDTFKNLLKTTKPVITKINIEPPGMEETKICSNHPGYMTNVATTPTYVKKL